MSAEDIRAFSADTGYWERGLMNQSHHTKKDHSKLAHDHKEPLLCRVVILLLFISFCCCIGVSGDMHSNSPLINEEDKTPPISIPLTAEEIDRETALILGQTERDILSILNVPEERRDENNTLIALDKSLTLMDARLKKYEYLSLFYIDPSLALAARDASLRQKEFVNNLSRNQSLYHAIVSVVPEDGYGADLREGQITYFRQFGAEGSQEEQEEIFLLYLELETLEGQYLQNIRDDGPLSENLNIIQRMAVVREKIAISAGYLNWNEMQNVRQIGGEKKRWQEQLTALSYLGKSIVQPVQEELLALKRQTYPDAPGLFDYEIVPLLNQYAYGRYETYQDSPQFPRVQTIRRSLEVVSCLLGVRTQLIPDAEVYAPGVELYRVADGNTGKVTGWFYLDMTDRPGKIPQWMTITLYPGLDLHNNDRNGDDVPVFLLSGAIKPYTHSYWIDAEDLTLLFHELGHLYSRVSLTPGEEGSDPGLIPGELTETPSLLFEYLLWTPEMIGLLTEPSVPSVRDPYHLPKGFLSSQSPGSLQKRWELAHQIVLSLLDSRIASSSGDLRFGEWYNGYYQTITGFTATDQGGYLLRHPHFGSSFSGLYWMYPGGELSAIRLYTRFLRDGVLNRTTWTDLKDVVFSSGYSTDAEERVRSFSGTTLEEADHWYLEPGYSSDDQVWKTIMRCNS